MEADDDLQDEEAKSKVGRAKPLSSSHYTISATGSQFTSPFFHPAPAGATTMTEEEAKGKNDDMIKVVNMASSSSTHRGEPPHS